MVIQNIRCYIYITHNWTQKNHTQDGHSWLFMVIYLYKTHNYTQKNPSLYIYIYIHSYNSWFYSYITPRSPAHPSTISLHHRPRSENRREYNRRVTEIVEVGRLSDLSWEVSAQKWWISNGIMGVLGQEYDGNLSIGSIMEMIYIYYNNMI